MNARQAEFVRRRAARACEYCRLPEALHPGVFEFDHVRSRKHRGKDVLANRAYACLRCNRLKGSDVAGLEDRGSEVDLVRLFNPRTDRWLDHFHLADGRIVGKTAIGRVTASLLKMNTRKRILLRKLWAIAGLFPPPESN